MRRPQQVLAPFPPRFSQCGVMTSFKPWIILFFLSLAASSLAGPHVRAQAPDRIAQGFDPAQVQLLANHHPAWANPANDLGAVPANQPLENLTFVLARSDEQEQAFDQLLADQLNPASPDYHRWLTPQEIGQRFGISDSDISAIAAWLQSQGLHVSWVSQSRILINFGGTAGDMGRAFQTEFHNYKVNDKQRISVASDPVVPSALAPLIKAVRGFYTVEDHAFHLASPAISNQPGMTITSGGTTYHFIAPADFSLIYDLPAAQNGSGTTIGIVGEARTDMADYVNFKSLTSSTFSNPTEVIPALQGGADPGSAYTAVPACAAPTNTCAPSVNQLIDAQSEAELDVTRAGTVAPGASILLVTATAASGGIAADTEYLVDTSPVPAQVISISFGACETAAGSGNVMFWDSLFKMAAGEGISIFVASGDAGASECDSYFTTPPVSPSPNSPNYICSSSYATCVGGTEFADSANPSLYWNSTSNSTTQLSALGYIPEGAWNEPLTSGGGTEAAATGGGVSVFIATPSWQTGSGVPPARLGRYTPDVAFPAAGHDGYLGCFAAGGGSCVSNGSGIPFEIFGGTSAAAPSMSGVAALLDQKLGGAQGNLNPATYALATSTPAAFHTVSIATSGVSSCSVATPSMCNNSIPSPTGLTGGQAGFSLGATGGYSEVTGLGSLDVSQYINNYSNTVATITPTVTVSAPPTATNAQSVVVLVTVNGGTGNPAPTGTIQLTGGSSTQTAGLSGTSGSSNSITFTIPAGALPVGTDTLTSTFTSNSGTYSNATGTTTISITSSLTTPTVTVTPSATSISTAQSVSLAITVNGGTGKPTPTGGVVVSSGSYSANAGLLTNGNNVFVIPAGSLAVGGDTVTVTYTPDTSSVATFSAATGTTAVTVTATSKTSPLVAWSYPSPITYGTALGPAQLDATANVPGAFVYNPFSGTVLSAGQQVLTVNFTPTDTATYATATDMAILTVNKASPAITWATPAPISYGTTLNAAQLNATANVPGLFTYSPGAGSTPHAGPAVLTATFTPTDATDYAATTSTVTLTVNKAAPTITWPTPASVSVGTALTSAQLNASASTPGTFVYTPPAGTVMSSIGSVTLSAAFTPTDATDFNAASSSVTLTVTAAVPPPSASTGSATSVASTSATVNAQVTPNGADTHVWFVYGITPSLVGASQTPSQDIGPGSSSVAVTANLSGLTPTATYYFQIVAQNSSGTTQGSILNFTTPAAVIPSFTISGTTVTLTAGATSGNTSTITVTPSGGFTGAMSLSAAITKSPGSNLPPTFSWTPANAQVSISGTSSATATLTIATTAPTSGSCTAENQPQRGLPWYSGGATLACLLLFGIPAKRRKWQTFFGLVALCFALAIGLAACGGGSSTKACSAVAIAGTSTGAYTITITGTPQSGTAQTGIVNLTVN